MLIIFLLRGILACTISVEHMELENSNFITIKQLKPQIIFASFINQKEKIQFKKFICFILILIYVLVVLIVVNIVLYKKIKEFIISFNYNKFDLIPKDLNYYMDIQNKFCNDIHNIYNKKIEETINLYNVSMEGILAELFFYESFDKLNLKKELNQSSEEKSILHMIKALEYYENKFNYPNNSIVVIDLESYLGIYTTLFGKLNFTVLSFEPLWEKNYILKKNFCRNIKNFFGPSPTIIIINETVYPNETFCDYYKHLKNEEKSLILCDKRKAIHLDKNYLKIDTIKTSKLINYIPLIKNKKITLLILDLRYEGENCVKSERELITEYHIPYIFIKFDLMMFSIHETKPKDFLLFFIQNRYKISLDGFLVDQFISVEDILKSKFSVINIYLVYFDT